MSLVVSYSNLAQAPRPLPVDAYIVPMFANGESGAAFRVSPEFAFADAAATTPATINGPVGALKSLAGTVSAVTQATGANQPILRGTPTGANLIGQDGDFFTPANWTLGAGWTIVDGALTGTTASGIAELTFAAQAGKTYCVTYYIARSAGSVTASVGDSNGRTYAATRCVREWITASTTGNLQIAGAGFSGTIVSLRIFDADAGAVGAPYVLSFTGSQWLAGALSGFVAYPLTLASDVSGGFGGAVSAWTDDTHYDALLDFGIQDRESAGELDAYTSIHPEYLPNKVIGSFRSSAIQAEAFLVAETPVANSHSFTAKNTVQCGRAKSGFYYCDGSIRCGLMINRALTSAELESLRAWIGAWDGVQCWGDSLTAGTGTDLTHTYPARLMYETGFEVERDGVGGQTSAQILSRVQADTSRKREWVQVFWAGTNDSIVTDGLGPTQANIAAMVATVPSPGRYLVLGMCKYEGGATTPQNLDDMSTYLQATYGDRFVDERSYLQSFNDGSANDLDDIANGLVPRSLRSDGVHLNNRGYQLVANCVAARMKSLGWL